MIVWLHTVSSLLSSSPCLFLLTPVYNTFSSTYKYRNGKWTWQKSGQLDWIEPIGYTCKMQTLTLINKSSRFLWQRFSKQDLRPRRVREGGSRIISHLSSLQFHPQFAQKWKESRGHWMNGVDVFHLFRVFPECLLILMFYLLDGLFFPHSITFVFRLWSRLFVTSQSLICIIIACTETKCSKYRLHSSCA